MIMHMSAASEPGGENPNEDWFGCLPDTVVVLDGVTVRPGMESGCVHGTPWYVRQLGSAFLCGAAAGFPLPDALALAIEHVTGMHERTCDLSAIGSPSAAAAAIRVSGSTLEWLILADVSVILDAAEGIQVISDHRVAESTTGLDSRTARLSERIGEARAAHRNRPGGYWVAAADPAAAQHAVTGSVPLDAMSRVMVATDGAARLVDLFGNWRGWGYALDIGPARIIRQVRAFEAEDEECTRWPRMKPRDDATAVLWAAIRPGDRSRRDHVSGTPVGRVQARGTDAR